MISPKVTKFQRGLGYTYTECAYVPKVLNYNIHFLNFFRFVVPPQGNPFQAIKQNSLQKNKHEESCSTGVKPLVLCLTRSPM